MSANSNTSKSTKEYQNMVGWFNAIGLLVVHLLAIYGVWLAYASARFATSLWAAALVFLARESITIGAHRLFSHRSFKAAWPTRLLIVLLQTIAGENCVYIWVRDHRQHHKYCDTDADPFRSHRRLLLPYIGWLMVEKHPEVIATRKTIDMTDIEADSFVMLQKRYYSSLLVILAILLPVAVPMTFWKENLLNSVMIAFFLRHAALLYIMRYLNSAAHMYSNRPNDKHSATTQTSAVSFSTSDEGKHNYHYEFPWDYRASDDQNFSISTAIIKLMAKLAMVYDLRVASPNKNSVMKNFNGSRPSCNELNNQKPNGYTEGTEGTTDQSTEDDSLQGEQTTMQHSLHEQKTDEAFRRSSNNPRTNSETQKKPVVEDALLQKIFSDLGFDEDVANERNFVSSSLLNNRQRLVHTARTESARHG